jgi:hypothetical protein
MLYLLLTCFTVQLIIMPSETKATHHQAFGFGFRVGLKVQGAGLLLRLLLC